MEKIIEKISEIIGNLGSYLSVITIKDILDIILVTVVIFFAFKFIKDRRAGRLIVGIIVLVVVKIVCDFFEMSTMSYILKLVFENGLLAIIIIFQPELRSALETMGGEPFKNLKLGLGEQKNVQEVTNLVNSLCDSVCDMAKDKTGALIVIERNTKLGEIAASGEKVDAVPSKYIIKNIFFKNSPLHDGAMLIRENRIDSAGCFLPLSNNMRIIRDLGTRHRAAIGMSEVSDAIIIVVSEETGNISIASGGKINRNFDYSTLKNYLTNILVKPLKAKRSPERMKHEQETDQELEQSTDTENK